MTLTAGASSVGKGKRKHSGKASTATHCTNLIMWSGICVEAGPLEERVG
jgi:hypothetical protein